MSSDYRRIERSLHLLHQSSLSLEELARRENLSPSYFQRLFRVMVGVSPKRYRQERVARIAGQSLREGSSTLEASLMADLSSPGRLHDLFVSIEGMTPGEYKSSGRSLSLDFGVHWTPLGPCCIVLAPRGICGVHFLPDESVEDARNLLEKEWPGASLHHNPVHTAPFAFQIFSRASWDGQKPFHLSLKGTNFQIQVWRALLRIPDGSTRTYGEVCAMIDRPKTSSRAVARAIATNPVALLIPCHRVIRSSGALSGYRWGVGRKERLLKAERSL